MLPLYSTPAQRVRRERSDDSGISEKNDSSTPPASFICLLTGSVMQDPVLLISSAGRSYERKALERWLANRPNRDPATNLEHENPLSFVSNRTLKDAIDDWLRTKRNNKRRRDDITDEITSWSEEQEATLGDGKNCKQKVEEQTTSPCSLLLKNKEISLYPRLITASGNDIRIWNTHSHDFQILARLAVTSICWLCDEDVIAVGCMDGYIRLLDLRSSQRPPRILSGHRGIVWCVASLERCGSSSGSLGLVSGAHDATIRLWRQNKPTIIISGHCCAVRAVCILPKNTRNTEKKNNILQTKEITCLASASIDKTVCIWHLSPQQQELITTLQHPAPVYSLAAFPNGDRLATGAEAIRIWSLDTGRLLRIICDHSHSVYALSLLPDATILLSGSNDNTARLFNVDTGDCLGILQGHTNSIDTVAVFDQHTVITGSWDQSIKFFSLDSMQCITTLQQRPRAWIRACLILPPPQRSQHNDIVEATIKKETSEVELLSPHHQPSSYVHHSDEDRRTI